MASLSPRSMLIAAVAAVVLPGAPGADAQPADQLVVVRGGKSANTPRDWSWELRDGKRVPRGERVDNPDGSWRETIKVGSCKTVRERSSAGEYREVRGCD